MVVTVAVAGVILAQPTQLAAAGADDHVLAQPSADLLCANTRHLARCRFGVKRQSLLEGEPAVLRSVGRCKRCDKDPT